MTERAGEPEYVSAAETAKIVRKALRAAFPGVRFSVRTRTFSGGAALDVHWRDGPETGAVRAVTEPYEGGYVDGSTDLAVDLTHWLRPDGSVLLQYDPVARYPLGNRREDR